MSNIFLTDTCDRGCKFCFAKEGPWTEDYPSRELTIEEIEEIINFPGLTDRPEIGLLGGEPFQYPLLTNAIKMAWDKNIKPTVFTSGSCSIPEKFLSLNINDNISFIVNINHWDTYSSEQQRNLEHFLRTFGKCIHLSYTILDPYGDFSFILDYVRKFNLHPSIRISIALPIAGGYSNEYLTQDFYRDIASFIIKFAKSASKQNVALGMDCGFVACMFEIKEIGLLIKLGVNLRFSCGPAIDIGPNLESWHCFPLSKFPRVQIRNFKNMFEVDKKFKGLNNSIREKFGYGIYKRCHDCKYRVRQQCDGGCLGLMIPKFNDMEKDISLIINDLTY